VIAAISRGFGIGGSRTLPPLDLAPDVDSRRRLARALSLLAGAEVPLVLAGAAAQVAPAFAYRDVVALVVLFAIAATTLARVSWDRLDDGWLLAPLAMHVIFVATLVAMTGGGHSPFFILYAPLLALGGWNLRGRDLAVLSATIGATEIWRAVAVEHGNGVDGLTIGLPVFALLGLLAYATSCRMAAASALVRLDAITAGGAVDLVDRLDRESSDPLDALAREAGQLFDAEATVLRSPGASRGRATIEASRGYLHVPVSGATRTYGLLQLWRKRDFTSTEARIAALVARSVARDLEVKNAEPLSSVRSVPSVDAESAVPR
jgi:hypothetical protein